MKHFLLPLRDLTPGTNKNIYLLTEGDETEEQKKRQIERIHDALW